MNAEITRLAAEKESVESNLEVARGQLKGLEEDKVSLEMKMAELEEVKDAGERVRQELEADIQRLHEKLEYEKQPDIAFEKENEQLQTQVRKSSLVSLSVSNISYWREHEYQLLQCRL